jgi:hypothetical protein
VYLAPSEPSKIICVHLNHVSRVREFMAKLPPRAHLLPEADVARSTATAAQSCVPSAASG